MILIYLASTGFIFSFILLMPFMDFKENIISTQAQEEMVRQDFLQINAGLILARSVPAGL